MKAHNSHQPEGNYYDKYHSSNPIVRWMMKNFFAAFTELLQETEAVDSILEAGCGEGEVSDFLWKYYGGSCPIDAFDRSEKVIRQAAEKNADIRFFEGDIYDLARGGYSLVVCSEVLEHLEHPETALEKLVCAAEKYIIVSVPREPLWRVLNMLRGKYWRSLGNTPGHVRHWSSRSFVDFLQGCGAEVQQIKRPLPWTMVLLKKK